MNNKGMAAIVTVIILGALMVLIGSVMTLTSISEGQTVLTETKVKNNQTLLDACAEESLLKINENNALPSNIVTPFGSCAVTINSNTGTNWNLDLSTSGEMSPIGVNLVLDRGSIISVSSWSDK